MRNVIWATDKQINDSKAMKSKNQNYSTVYVSLMCSISMPRPPDISKECSVDQIISRGQLGILRVTEKTTSFLTTNCSMDFRNIM